MIFGVVLAYFWALIWVAVGIFWVAVGGGGQILGGVGWWCIYLGGGGGYFLGGGWWWVLVGGGTVYNNPKQMAFRGIKLSFKCSVVALIIQKTIKLISSGTTGQRTRGG